MSAIQPWKPRHSQGSGLQPKSLIKINDTDKSNMKSQHSQMLASAYKDLSGLHSEIYHDLARKTGGQKDPSTIVANAQVALKDEQS